MNLRIALKPQQGYNKIFDVGEYGMKLTKFGLVKLPKGAKFNGDTGETVQKTELHPYNVTGEHAEMGIRIGRHVEPVIGILAVARLFDKPDVQHFVHAKMLHCPVFPGKQIIILIVQQQCPGTDRIPRSVPAEDALTLYIPGEVAKHDLLV